MIVSTAWKFLAHWALETLATSAEIHPSVCQSLREHVCIMTSHPKANRSLTQRDGHSSTEIDWLAFQVECYEVRRMLEATCRDYPEGLREIRDYPEK